MPTSLDPVLIYAASFLLGAIFLAGAYHKLKNRELFVGIVQAYGLLPVPLVVVFSLCVALAELTIGLALWVPRSWPAAQLAGCALLAVVTAAVVINLLRGRPELSCGCGGASADQELSWSLVARNVVLGVVLLSATATPLTRTLTVFDYGTIVLATGIGFGLYAALNQLLANAPRLASFGFSG